MLLPAHFVRTSKKDKIKAERVKELLLARDLLDKEGKLPKVPDSVLLQAEKEKEKEKRKQEEAAGIRQKGKPKAAAKAKVNLAVL